MQKLSDEWRTPDDLYQELDKEFGFQIDLCPTKENSKCRYFYTHYLNNKLSTIDKHHESWPELEDRGPNKFKTKFNFTPICFMNPPYSNPKPFIEKAWEDSKYCKIVCLVKYDPSTKWWATFWNYQEIQCDDCLGDGYIEVSDESVDIEHCFKCNADGIFRRGPKPGCEVRFFSKRIKFDPPQQLVDNGDVWKVENKWVQGCTSCDGDGYFFTYAGIEVKCLGCKGKGCKELSGPTFPSALIIMDRRGL